MASRLFPVSRFRTAPAEARKLRFVTGGDMFHDRRLLDPMNRRAGRENPGGMVTLLGLERERVNDAVDDANHHGIAQVANLNCPNQIIVSGTVIRRRTVSALSSGRSLHGHQYLA